MLTLQARFYPSWFHERYGMTFGQRYANDIAYRVELNRQRQRLVHERFGDVGLGAAQPKPDPDLRAVFKNLLPMMFGARLRQADDDGWIEPADVDPEALWRLAPPRMEDDPCIAELVRQAAWFERMYAPAVLNPGIDGILNAACALCGERFLTWLVEQPAAARHVLSVLRETAVRVHEHFRRRCGQPAPMGLGNCTVCMIRPATYREFVFDLDLVWCRRAQSLGLPFGFHMDGRIDAYLDVINAFPYLQRVDMGSDSDVALARRRLGDKTIRVYLYPHMLRGMSAEAIDEFVAELHRQSGPAHELVLQLDVSAGMGDALVRAVAQAARRHG